MPINIDGSKGIRQNTTEVTKIPVGTTAQRPANPEAGMIRFNTDNGQVEGYNDPTDEWRPISQFFQQVVATGGTVTNITQDGQLFRVHTFTSDGTFKVTRGGEVDVLVVAGGGGGGSGNPDRGGGGAGGLVLFTDFSVVAESHSVVVSAGASGGDNTNPSRALDSTFAASTGTLTAIGGGPADGFGDGVQGGSGGGGGGGGQGASSLQGGTNSGALFDAGNAGGSGSRFLNNDGTNSGAGGGGAGEPGGNGTSSNGNDGPAGDGGAGLDLSAFFGTAVGDNGFFSGGGAGSATNSTNGLGGIGGGGNVGEDGAPNTGGGGGAAPSGSATIGGSGIVIVRYRIG